MDHRTFLTTIPPAERTRLTALSDRAGLTHLSGHLALIGLLAGAVFVKVPGWPVLMLPLGIVLIFLFTLQHETTHQTPFRNRALNEWVGRFCGLILLLPPTWFRLFHLAHHRHTQDLANDPELATPKPKTRAQYILHISGLPVWRTMIGTLLRNATGRADDAYVPPSRRAHVRDEARLMLGLYAFALTASLAEGSFILLWVWIMPMLLGQPFLRLYLLAEHGRCATVANMLENTRTTLTNRAVRWIAWNMPYHTEHHVWPTVPFHRLPELHRLMHPHLAEVSPGYVPFHRELIRELSTGVPDAH